jgi:hypothetical protein
MPIYFQLVQQAVHVHEEKHVVNITLVKFGAINKNGTYDIDFDDGDRRENAPLNTITCALKGSKSTTVRQKN